MSDFGAGMAGGATVAIIIKASDEFSSVFEKATADMGDLQKFSVGLTGSFVALAGGVAELASQFVDMAKEAGQAAEVQSYFNTLAGDGATAALEGMRQATDNTISDLKLMQTANSALVRGINTENIPALTEYAHKMSEMNPTLGDATQLLDGMSMAVATGRTMHLKELGIIVDNNEAYKKYAMSIGLVNDAKGQEIQSNIDATQKQLDYYESVGGSHRMISQLKDKLKELKDEQKSTITSQSDFGSVLDDTQKKAALQAGIMDSVQAKLKTMPPDIENVGKASEQMTAAWENQRVKMGAAVSDSVTALAQKFMPALTQLGDFVMQHIVPAMDLFFQAVGKLMDSLGNNEEFMAFIGLMGYAVEGIITFFALVIRGIAYLVDWQEVFVQWGKIIVGVVKDKVIGVFHLFQAEWELTKNLFMLGVDYIMLGAETMANRVMDTFQSIANTIIGWINTVIDAYDAVAAKMGWGQISRLANVDFSGAKFNTAALEANIQGLQGQVATNIQNINVAIQQVTGADPQDIANALRKQLNDLVSS